MLFLTSDDVGKDSACIYWSLTLILGAMDLFDRTINWSAGNVWAALLTWYFPISAGISRSYQNQHISLIHISFVYESQLSVWTSSLSLINYQLISADQWNEAYHPPLFQLPVWMQNSFSFLPWKMYNLSLLDFQLQNWLDKKTETLVSVEIWSLMAPPDH